MRLGMPKQRLAERLTYSGTIPFWGLVVLTIWFDTFPVLGIPLDHLVFTYAAVIASFIAGIHWGVYLFKDTALNLFIQSNIIALLAWGSHFVMPIISVIILIYCFLHLIVIDRVLFKHDVIDYWFYAMRIKATLIVVSTLVIFGVLQVL